MNAHDLSARLRETFVAELDEGVRTLNTELLALEEDAGNADRLRTLFRIAHTLKGAARAASVPLVEDTCHRMESLLAAARDAPRLLHSGEVALLFRAADALGAAAADLAAGRALNGALADVRTEFEHGPPADAGIAPEVRPSEPRAAKSRPAALVRVRMETVDALLQASEQLMVATARVTTVSRDLLALREDAARLLVVWRGAERAARVALDRAGLSTAARALHAFDEQLRDVVSRTQRTAGRASRDASALAAVSADVGFRAQRLRLRPFADACEALPRAVRDLAVSSHKRVRLVIEGADVEADRGVLDALREALVPLIRNAIDHGIELPAARERVGKSPDGTVVVSAVVRGGKLFVRVRDDGAGLDVAAIRAQLSRRGISVPPGDRNVARALFAPGFSTHEAPSLVSGRGMGLDIVQAIVARIRGSVDLESQAGGGTTAVIECSRTLATLRALFFSLGSQTLALPLNAVVRVQRVRPEDLVRLDGGEAVPDPDGPIPIVSLSRLLPALPQHPPSGTALVIVLAARGSRLGIAVDDIDTEHEVVVRPLGSAAGNVPLVSGAALLADGGVALLLDPPQLVALAAAATPAERAFTGPQPSAAPTTRCVLVVDDSLTTRTLEQSILESAGYGVVTAVDGAEAWDLLQQGGIDIVVCDVDMPRLDGFQLCRTIRDSRRFARLPFVLVTALESDAHRARGLEVGADAYLGKSSFDQQRLLETIRQLVA